MASYHDDIKFLQKYLENLKKDNRILSRICDREFVPLDASSKTTNDAERCARLADDCGFDGDLFRNLFDYENYAVVSQALREKISTIPRIIRVVQEKEKSPTKNKSSSPRKTTVNQQMMTMISDETYPSLSGWSAQQWADELNCSKQAVAKTRAWHLIIRTRGQQKDSLRNTGHEK